jgi:hypothetical protein
MACQGFDPRDFLFSEGDYKVYAGLAGNSMTSSVVGAAVFGLIMGVLVKDADNK